MSNIEYDPTNVDRGDAPRKIGGYGIVPDAAEFPQNELAGVHGAGFGPNDWPAPPVSSRRASLETERRANVSHSNGEVRKARDKAQYVRQQKGHSWIMEWLVLGVFTLWIRPIYLAVSPNHFFHL